MSSLLKKASWFFVQKRYSQVVALLSPHSSAYKKNFEYHFLLGLALLYQEDFRGSQLHLEQSFALNHDHQTNNFALALAYLRQRKTSQAVQYVLKVLEVNHRHCKAKKLLVAIEQKATHETLYDFFLSKDFKRLYPKLRFSWYFFLRKYLFYPSLLLVVLGFSYIFLFFVQNRESKVESLRSLEPIILQEQETFLTLDPVPMLNKTQIEEGFKKVLTYYSQAKDNLALQQLNSILYSGAPIAIKEKARLLKSQAYVPRWLAFENTFSLQEIEKNPYEYQDVFVKWSGEIQNLHQKTVPTSFNFLVGYDNREHLVEGEILVSLDFPINIDNGHKVEIFGQIQLTHKSSDSKKDTLNMEVIGVLLKARTVRFLSE